MKTFIVLGMHRSATSLCAKGLYESGVHMGEVLLRECESNIYGHFENTVFVGLNQAILKEAGGSWDNPPPEQGIIEAGEKLKDRIKDTIKQQGEGKELWGWKDPRTTLTIRCYFNYLINPHIFACFRSPIEVAKSLTARDGFSLAQGVRLANEYNTRLLDFMYNHYLVDYKKGD